MAVDFAFYKQRRGKERYEESSAVETSFDARANENVTVVEDFCISSAGFVLGTAGLRRDIVCWRGFSGATTGAKGCSE